RFAASIEGLYRKGYRLFLEIGPRPTLSFLGQQTVGDESAAWLPSMREGQDEWQTILATLGSLYVRGTRIDWGGFDRGYARERVSLPTYPFERSRYWVERRPAPAASYGAGVGGGHPLLGQRLESPAIQGLVFQSRLSPASPAFIGEHRVFDVVVLPGTAYIEMALDAAAGSDAAGTYPGLCDLAIHEAMIFGEEEVREAQVVVDSPAGADPGIRVYSRGAGGDGGGAWTLHASARLSPGSGATAPDISLEEARRRCGREVPGDSLHARLRELGIALGPRFRGIAGLWCGTGEALARVELPTPAVGEVKSYRFHPVWLDACVQTLAGAMGVLGNGADPAVYMPIGIDSVEVCGSPRGTLWSHAAVTGRAAARGETVVGNITVYDEHGRVVARLTGISLKKADRNALARIAGRLPDEAEGWLYEPAWEPSLPSETGTDTSRREGKESEGTGARWLVLADQGGVGERIANRLRETGSDLTILRVGKSFRTDGAGCFTLNPREPRDFVKWREIVRKDRSAPWKGVIHLWGLDCTPFSRTTPGALEEDASSACGGALHLLQALDGDPAPPRVWLVTRGARAIGETGVPVQPVQALLWGLGRSVALEHPEWRCTNVDLSPEFGPGDVSSILSELSVDDGEDRIAWRPEGRFVERLVRRRNAARRPGGNRLPAGPYTLAIGARGVLDNLRWQEVDRQTPRAGEVEVQVEATGLNFRDVLNAMGLYPGTPPFGSECAGRVSAVGEGVAHVRVGDPVVAIAPDSFRRFVCVPAISVRLRPVHRSAVEAVTAPIAYVTASFALEDIARLVAGERVLVHAAAGGVGLAAVHIARSAGAEVFATAGSETKRAYLRSLGIRHVMDSRSTEFARQIMDSTGGEGVHVVLNSLTGEAIPKSLAVLSTGGRFLELGKRGIWSSEDAALLRRDVRYEVIDWGATAQEDPDRIGKIFENVMDRVFSGELPVLPFRVFPATRIIDAFRHMNQGRHLGKVVVCHPSRLGDEARVSIPMRPDATYLVTGGLGGLGLLSASWLVERGARHLVLVGRRGPDDKAAAAIRGMESSGARVRTVSADVSDVERMRKIVRELVVGEPPLRGVIHSAGILDDGVLLQMDRERFERVLAPKVSGAWILHTETLGVPLDFFVAYSSIASLIGSAGQSNYAAANAFLDSLAWERRALGLPSVSINWGAWAEVGMATRRGVGERADETGIGGIPPAEGMEILGRLLDPESPQVGVAVVDWPRFLERTGSDRRPFFQSLAQARGAADDKADDASPVTWQEELAGLPAGNRLSLLETRIAEKAVRVLGIAGGQPPDPRRPLQEMGLDSLMAVELRNAIAQGSGRTLPSTLLFDHPTIEALVAFLAPLLGAGPETGIPTGEPSQGLGTAHANVVSRIEELSDEEVDRLLAVRTGKGSGSDE
ncbi:MAG: polyketide synthase family protein, partial [Deltaproteobacteria bacterium]|nr:polyketide synthase family protein [Deltaproteobacteria bacterium]